MPSNDSALALRVGDVLRYRSAREFMPRHCRDEWAVVHDAGEAGVLAVDTYWNSGDRGGVDDHCLTDDELAGAEVVFNLADYDELDRYSRGSEMTWETYHPDDRQRLPSQHGYRPRWFIRKGAQPNLETQIENAQRVVEKAESDLRWAEWQLKLRREDLAKLEAQRV